MMIVIHFFLAIAFISMALSCKADKGSQLGEKLFTACQEIGGNSLQNMFSPFPIFLTWLGSGCLIGWFVWPYFWRTPFSCAILPWCSYYYVLVIYTYFMYSHLNRSVYSIVIPTFDLCIFIHSASQMF